MSVSTVLQAAIYQALIADAGVAALVGTRIVDGRQAGLDYPNITFGPSDYVEDDAECITGRIEVQQLDIWSRQNGQKYQAKEILDAVKTALHETDLDLGVHGLHSLRLELARVVDDPDGITAHGIIQFAAIVEEN